MILKLQYPENPGTWMFEDKIKRVGTETVTRGYADTVDGQFFVRTKPTADMPLSDEVRLIHATYDNGEVTTFVAEFGWTYLLNDNGKTIERL